MYRLLPETAEDAAGVEALLDLAFAPGRQALSSYRLRDGVAPVAGLSTVVRDAYDSLVGTIRYWPVRLAGRPGLLLGPVAVHPTCQGEGLGALMITETLDRARDLGWARVVLVGDAPYYGRFGFRRALAAGLVFPGPVNLERVLALELAPGAVEGLAGPVTIWTNDEKNALPD